MRPARGYLHPPLPLHFGKHAQRQETLSDGKCTPSNGINDVQVR